MIDKANESFHHKQKQEKQNKKKLNTYIHIIKSFANSNYIYIQNSMLIIIKFGL